ncbi:MAG: ABC transporter permease subunit [Candidatus Thalassarchaeaceae archaeon]
MVSEAYLRNGRSVKSSADLLIVFFLFTLLFSLTEVSAQEVRSGWEVVDSGTEESLNTAEYLDGEMWAFGSGGTMIRSIDEGRTWSESGISVSQDLTSSDESYESMIVAGNRGTVLLMNGGVWFDVSSSQMGDITDIALTGNDSFVAIESSGVWTCSVTEEWVSECDLAIGGVGSSYLSVSFLDSKNGLISGESGAIIASTDGGLSWEYRDAPSEVSSTAIIDIVYYSTIRSYAISEEGHILKSSREGNVPVGFVWSVVDIEREYPPGGGDEFEIGGSTLDFEVSEMEVIGQFKFMLSGPGGYLSLSLDGGNIVSQQMIPVSNETVFNGFAMMDSFRGVAVGDGGAILRTDNAGSEEFVGFEVIDFNDFGQFVDYSKERLMDGLVATAKIVVFGILMGFSLGVVLSMLKTSPTTLKNVAQTNRFQILVMFLVTPLWLVFQTPISVINSTGLGRKLNLKNPFSSVLGYCRERSLLVAASEPLNIFAIRTIGLVLMSFGIYRIFINLDEIGDLNLDGWEYIYSPIGAPTAMFWILLGLGIAILGGIFVSCGGDFSIRDIEFGRVKISLNPWGIRPLNTIATVYTDIFRNTPLLVQFMFIHFGFELGRRMQDPGLLLFDFDYLEKNSNFITDIFVIYETNPESLAYGRPIGGILEDRAYISAIFALGLNSAAYQCETIRGAIAAIPSGQMEAGRSIGLNYMQSMRLVVMPQAVRICIPPLGNEMVNLVLNSSLAMIIGYAEITRQGKLIVATTFQVFWTWGMVLISYFLITWALALFLRYLEERTRIPGLGISGGA